MNDAANPMGVRAMVLAAGEGRRMRPLTLSRPKPLLPVAGRSLIEHQLRRLREAGIRDCVVNVAYLGDQIRRALGDGAEHGLRIHYSEEPYPLETGGALNRALPMLEDVPFVLANADVWCDYPLAQLVARATEIRDGHLVLVPNPGHHRSGDFALDERGRVTLPSERASQTYTFSGLSLLHPRVIRDYPQRREAFPLLEALVYSIARGGLTGEVFSGDWSDIGTPERLRELQARVSG